MTTIAATLTALAGDSMVFDQGKGIWYPALKVRRTKDAIVGASGDSGDCVRFLDWAAMGFTDKKRPKFTEEAGSEDSAILLLLNAEGIHIMAISDPYPELIAKDCFAIGSGGKAAHGALLAGKTLAEAMDIAYGCDPYTRPPYTILSLEVTTK